MNYSRLSQAAADSPAARSLRTAFTIAAVLAALLGSPTAVLAGLFTCLTGTDPSVASDLPQITLVRAEIDAKCPCESFDGSVGKTHARYVACASGVIRERVGAGALRPGCRGTVLSQYSASNCGVLAARGAVPCVKKTATGRVSCRIKSAALCVDVPGLFTQAACSSSDSCLEAADTNCSGTIDPGDSGDCTVPSTPPPFTMAQTVSDGAQRTTLAFSGLALITGNLEAQSFFPPGKVADYTGFQYLRDNDPDDMGHNTSFLTRVANNVIYILNDSQFAQLKTLASAQLERINLYGYKRFALMKAFRRLIDGDIPAGSSGLNLAAVKLASRELYLIDGQISFERALLYSNVLSSLDAAQSAYLAAMKGKGWNSWPDVTNDQIKSKMQGLPQGTAVAVMTYASDLFSWYAGSVEADVYFCPERHGTYFGSFYIKDAPAVGHEGYSIDEQLTATAGAALSDSKEGYVTQSQAELMSSLVDTQRDNLYASASANIVLIRTQIAARLRGLLISTAASALVQAQVLALSGIYGDLDGENNYHYATVFAAVHDTLTSEQKTKLSDLRTSIMSGTYADGTPFDYSVCTTPFLYSSVITDTAVLAPYTDDTDYLFFEP